MKKIYSKNQIKSSRYLMAQRKIGFYSDRGNKSSSNSDYGNNSFNSDNLFLQVAAFLGLSRLFKRNKLQMR